MILRKFILVALVLLVLPAQLQAETVENSPLEFVKGFYSWYLPLLLKNDNNGPASDIAIKQKVDLFSKELIQALRVDSARQVKCPGEICNLDYDPFLMSQDPPDSFEIGKITKKGGHFFVEILGSYSGEKTSYLQVTVELVKNGNSWVFVNFHSRPGAGDLLSYLKRLRKQYGNL